MSTELNVKYSGWVKLVEFFPYEWSCNLLAICLKDCIEIHLYEENDPNRNDLFSQQQHQQQSNTIKSSQTFKSQLRLITKIQTNVRQFSWSPKTNITLLRPTIQFACCDSENLIKSYEIETAINLTNAKFKSPDRDILTDLNNYDHVYKIAYDHYKGEMIAYSVDNLCILWDCVAPQLKAKFQLQSPGVNICWHRDETTKLMVVEKCGLIRVYSIETLQPFYTILSLHNKINSLPILYADWCQLNPAIVIASTNADMFIWNTSNSCIPEKLLQDIDNVKQMRLANYKENVIGYVAGNDICSKLKIFNYKTNQTIYQKKDIKLFKSFSFNASQALIAIAAENKVIITKLLN